MHSSWAQVMFSRSATSRKRGTEDRNRSTTETKITAVATAISVPISVSSSRSSSLSANIALLHACGRLLLDQLLDHLLADAPRDFPLNRRQRLDPDRALIGTQMNDLRASRLLDRRHRILVVLACDLALEPARLLDRTLERAPDVGRQCGPELRVDDHRIAQTAGVGVDRVLLHFMHFLRVHVGPRVLGAVDHAGLQRLIGVAERHHLAKRTARGPSRPRRMRT